MTYCKSISIKTLIVKSFSKCKLTNLGTVDGLEQVNGLNGTTDARWKNMIKLNDHTGDLTIRNIQTEHSGDYDLEINNSSMILHRKFHIAVSELPPISHWQTTGPVLAVIVVILIVIGIGICIGIKMGWFEICWSCKTSGATNTECDTMQQLNRDDQQQ